MAAGRRGCRVLSSGTAIMGLPPLLVRGQRCADPVPCDVCASLLLEGLKDDVVRGAEAQHGRF